MAISYIDIIASSNSTVTSIPHYWNDVYRDTIYGSTVNGDVIISSSPVPDVPDVPTVSTKKNTFIEEMQEEIDNWLKDIEI